MQDKQERELRMYFFVPYQLTGIQQAIQAGHALGEYALKFGRRNPDHMVWEFLEKWKTWMVLNGGTTNSDYDFNDDQPCYVAKSLGTLNQIRDKFLTSNIEFSEFYEPDLNNALTAVCFIADERVFDKKLYPDFEKTYNAETARNLIRINEYNIKLSDESFDMWYDPEIERNKHYSIWFDGVGGKDIVFLRDILKGTKFA